MKIRWLDPNSHMTNEKVVDQLLLVTAAGDEYTIELSEVALLKDPEQRQTRAVITMGDIRIHIEGGRAVVAGGTVAVSGPTYYDRRR